MVVTGSNQDDLRLNIESTIVRHFQWLSGIGMVCSLLKTELLYFGDGKISIKIGSTQTETMKVLGALMDKKLN